jgi:putative sterol carrier protein
MPTIAEQMKDLVSKFKAAEAKGWNRILQIAVTGTGGGVWHFIIQDQKVEFKEGENPKANMKVTTDVATWKSMGEGKLSGTSAFMSGKLKAQGPMADLIKTGKIFPGMF